MSEYWVVYIIFVPLGLFFGRSFIAFYGFNPLCYFADFFGVSYLFFEYGATMNVTWWFMSVIIIFYVFFPLIYRIYNYSPEILLVTAFAVLFCPFISEFRQIIIWICPFILGMYVSDNNLIERISNKGNKYKIAISAIIALFIFIYLRNVIFNNKTSIDSAIALFIVLISYLVFSRIPVLNNVLEELGKYSGLIFMFHTFIYSYYFKNFIYGFKYSLVIYIVMLVICYLIARLLNWLMVLTRYPKLINKLSMIMD